MKAIRAAKGKQIRSFVEAITLLAILSFPPAGGPAGLAQKAGSHSAGAPYGRNIITQGVPNLVEITPELYRGGQPTEVGFEALARMGIGIIVDGRELHWGERKKVERLGMKYVHIPWYCLFPTDKVFAKFLAVIRENPHKKIFVHCRLGDDRVAMMVASYRMAVQHWTADQAMREMQATGFSFSHHFLCPRLAGYERSFPERYRTDPIFQEPASALLK